MKVLTINSNSIKVQDSSNMILLVAKYQDSKGVYFFNEQLEKQYIETSSPKKFRKTSNLNQFEFIVEYYQGGDVRRKFSKVSAKDFDGAIDKINKRFKSIVGIEAC
jgi:hypothetical protein